MNLKNRLFLSVGIMALAALAIGVICVQASRSLFENQSKVYNSGLAVFHLKKVSDALSIDVTQAVQKVRDAAPWAWEDGAKVIGEADKAADEHWKAYMAMDKNKDEKYAATIVDALLANNKHLMEQLKVDFANKDARDLEIQAGSVLYPSIGPILDNLRKLEDINEKTADAGVNEAEKGFTSSSNFMIAAVILILLAGFFTSLFIGTVSFRPIGSLARNLDGNAGQISSLVPQISTLATQLGSQLLESSRQLQRAGSSMEQMTSLVQHNGQETTRVKNLVEETRVFLSGSQEMVQQTQDTLKDLNQNAEKVSQVVKTIEEIAFQTNILALNAGVEAIRAGEQGKEFVMVVEEIRNLSQRCSQVARETSQLVAVNNQKISEGLKQSEAAGRAISQTSEKAKRTVDLLGVVEEGLGDQAKGLKEIHSLVGQAEREAYQNSASGEKMETMGLHFTQQVEVLRTLSKQLNDLFQGGMKEIRRTSPKAKAVATGSVNSSESPVISKGTSLDSLMGEKTGTDGAKVIRMSK